MVSNDQKPSLYYLTIVVSICLVPLLAPLSLFLLFFARKIYQSFSGLRKGFVVLIDLEINSVANCVSGVLMGFLNDI